MSEPVYLEHDWFPYPVPANVVIGERSWLHSSHVFLHYRSERPCGVRIGHDSGIYVETFFDLGPEGELEIGNHCSLVGPVICTDGRVVIGDYALISREVVIADSFLAVPPRSAGRVPSDRRTGDGSRQRDGEGTIWMGDDVWIGTRAVVLAGARLGHGVIVGAGAVVDFEVPDYAIVGGNPARVVGWARPGLERKRDESAAAVPSLVSDRP